jgi:septal ring factor EnvC (AmiA/AmiB activator)
VFLAVKGIVGLALAAIVGVTVIQLAPVFSFKLANWKMKLIVSEATANPIETMQNLYAEKSLELETADQNIVDFETSVSNYHDQLDTFKEQYPEDADKYEELATKMLDALKDMKANQTQARKDLRDFAQQIKRAKSIWSMALAAQAVTKLSKSAAEAKAFTKIKEDAAINGVNTQMNRSFASLNLSMERRKDATSSLLPGPAVDGVTPITQKAKARISS